VHSKGLKYNIEDKHTVDTVIVDKIRLNQITMNLISNAVKYTPPEGTITISATDKLQDNGMVASLP